MTVGPRLLRFALLVCLLATTASAQVSEFRLERFQFNSGVRKGLASASGDLLDKGQLHLLLAFHYEHNPLLVYVDSNRLGAVVGPRVTTHLAAGYGITPWLQASVELPIILFQGGDTFPMLQRPDSFGISTPILHGRLGLLSQKKGGLALEDAPLDVAFGAAFVLPLATGATLSREFAAVPSLSAGRDFGKFRLGGEVAGWIRPSNIVLSSGTSTIKDSVGHQLSTRLIASTTVLEKLHLEGSAHLGIPLEKGSTPVGFELLLGARYPVWLLEVFALGGPGFGQLPGTPAFRLMLGANLAPKRDVCLPGEKHVPTDCPDLDDDGDGIKNRVDVCALEPEDKDGWKDDDGCPDPDDDGDGVLDVADKCVRVKGVAEFKGCPPPPPPPDSDKDGIIDAQDKCPSEPGLKERQGCPIRDADKDTVEDADDACPNEAGPVERKGCPVKDRDADTVEDAVDNCPDEAGDPANQGCPKAKKQLVVITAEKLVIKDRVYFATAKSVILPKSFGLLDQVASVLKSHGEIALITVEGHTDDRGKRDYNVKLSGDRAESVRQYLIKAGVAAERLKAIGYGPDKPADTNATEAGRANNRRVEFVIETPEKVKIEAKEVK